MADLNSLISPSSGWTLSAVAAINNSGDIVGYGLYNGNYEAFLLTPTPEPASLGLMAIGAMGLPLARRKRATCR